MIKLVLFYFTLLSCFFAFSQKETLKHIFSSKTTTKQEKILAVDFLLSQPNLSKEHKTFNFTNYGKWLYKNKEYTKAISIAQKDLKFSKKHFKDSICFIKEKYFLLGYYLYKNNDCKYAIEILKEPVVSLHNNCKYAIKIYSTLAKCYKKLGDYHKTIAYHQYVLNALKQTKNHKSKVSNAINISQAYTALGGKENIEKGRSFLIYADSLSKKNNLKYSTLLIIVTALGESYNFDETLDIKKGSFYFDKALELALKKKDSLKISSTLSKKGNLYNTTNLNLAIYYQKESIRFIPREHKTSILFNYGNLAYCYAQKKEFIISNEYYIKTVKLLTGEDIHKLSVNKKAVYNCYDKENLFITLIDYTSSLYKQYSTKKDNKHLKNILSIYFLAEELIELIRINSSELNSKLYWRKQANKLYTNAVKSCFALNDKEQAFYFMEKNKALILLEDLHYQKMKAQANLPNEIITQEKELLTEVYVLKKRLNEKNNDSGIQNVFFKKKLELEKLQDSIGKLLPNALKLKTSLIATLKQAQKNCKADEAVLEYIIHDNFGYGLLIEKEKSCLFELKSMKDLKNNISQIRGKLSKPFYTKKDFNDYNSLAFKTYQQLFPTKEIQAIIKNKKTIVIPDGYLSFLPFEALVSNNKTNTFLIESTEISYGLSYSFLHNNLKKERKEPSMVAFAPECFENYQLATLTNSIHEVTAINNSITSLIFINKKASKANFIKELPKHSIIHLATHADAYDSITPWIAFQDKKLLLEELYLTKNNADLVVLSACKTNDGKLAEGEGVMSLSRGFFQTGTKSIVASLWNVDDKATANIIIDFYKNLKKQQTKPEALRNAKLTYFKNNSLSESSPYYWAPLVYLGKRNTIELPQKYYLGYYIISLGILLLGIFYFLFKKKVRIFSFLN
ncbi:MAG: hypothetical protein COA88_15930 [Kordia sp.]|nr:MAG: hypothetical protein COA88_15930 [Kordia sp.]